MKIVRVGSEYRLSLTKLFCQEVGINIGDSYEVSVGQDGVLTLYPTIKLNVENQNSNEKTVFIEKGEDDKNNIQVSKNCKKEEFKSNLEEGKNYSKKYYTECGLIIRTKRKYLDNYCDRCRGQLLDNYKDGCYSCKYKSTLVTTLEEPSINEEDTSDRNSLLKDIIRKEDKETAKQNNKFVVASINKHIEELLKSLSASSENNINTKKLEDKISQKARTLLSPISFNHYHTCDKCNDDFKNGFLIDNKRFLCKSCAKEDFIKYLKEIGKEFKNV